MSSLPVSDGLAWDVAGAAAEASGVALVELTSLEDADRVRTIIDHVWGEQVLPREMLRALQHAGSVLLGAEAEGTLVGFVLGIFGMDRGLHLHSHMLAVEPGWQDRGVGRALKLGQRARCLDRGVGEVRWTFDPLVARNARFNLVRLGAEAIRFLPAFYGEMTDRLNAGDRSDRFEVRWELESPRVTASIAGEQAAAPSEGAVEVLSAPGGEPRRAGDPKPGQPALVAIPDDHLALRTEAPDLGMAWREEAARAFEDCFQANLVARWITRERVYVFSPAGADR